MRERTRLTLVASIALAACAWNAAIAQDLYIRDTPADTGVQPNPDTGPI